MSSVMKELKTEISRLARKELSKELEPVRRVNATQRGLIADLRRQLVVLQKDLNALRKAVPAPVESPEPEAAKSRRPKGKRGRKKTDARKGFWITGKGVRSLRKRLGVSQTELGSLVGVSTWTVVNWEAAEGKIALRRKDTAARLESLRKQGKRAVAGMIKQAAEQK